MPTALQAEQMAYVDDVRDPITGVLIFPDLAQWHGQVADYFCAVLVHEGAIGPVDCYAH
jgi:hypothetical protein